MPAPPPNAWPISDERIETIVDLFAEYGSMTAQHLEQLTGWPPGTVRPAIAALKKQGTLVEVGRTRQGKDGRMRVVWALG